MTAVPSSKWSLWSEDSFLCIGCRGSGLVATAANCCPAFGSYRVSGPGTHRPFALQVLEISDGQIAGLHNFLFPELFAVFDLPHFLDDVASAIAHYRFGHLGFEGDNNWRVYVPQLFAQDPIPTLLALALVPGLPVVTLEPEIVLLVFLPPLL